MAHLQIDLWPVGVIVTIATAAIVAMRALERRADHLASKRTRQALERTVAEPTQE